MGFSVSGATALVFVGLLVSAATLYPTVARTSELRFEATQADDERSLARQNTGIDVRNATYNATTTTLNVTVENTRATTLSANATDLLVDGVLVTNATTTVEGESRDVWASGETLVLEVSLPSQPSRVKVVTKYGVADTVGVV